MYLLLADNRRPLPGLYEEPDEPPPTLEVSLARYRKHFVREEQRRLFLLYIRGLLSTLERKTIQPIAARHGKPRRALQRFVGAGLWDDRRLTSELRSHVREAIGDTSGVLVLDTLAFPKKGRDSVGVARQRHRDARPTNCQLGVFATYGARGVAALVGASLYLPAEWTDDAKRLAKCHVPSSEKHRPLWRHADDLAREGHELPHSWILGGEGLAAAAFRERLRARGERYLLALDGEERPLDRTPQEGERIVRTPPLPGETEPHAWVTNDSECSLDELAAVVRERAALAERIAAGRQRVGLDDYEVRSWVGWHHHMALAFVAHFLLECLGPLDGR